MEIIQFLIFGIIVIIAIVQQVAKGAPKAHPARKRPMPAYLPEAETVTGGTEAPAPPRRKHKQHKPAQPFPKAQAVAASPKGKGVRTGSDVRIKLNTREEARRAFIYSEIFNRKY